ncbi:hypothetical protein Bbelb_317430 [Branchiostoma belcheri]|nr:hypothetical protein Bbelb_317430 [Branchiostoma belcheri]
MRPAKPSTQLTSSGSKKRRATYKRSLFDTLGSFHREVKKAKAEGEPFPTRPLSGQHQENSGGKVQKWLRVKDKFVISDEGYHEIRMLSKATVPPLYRVIEERVRQNGMITILTEANNNMARRSVKKLLAHLLRHPKHRESVNAGDISVRFSGDGRQAWVLNKETERAQLHHTIDEEASIFVYEGGEDHEVQRETAGMVYKEIEDIRKNGLTIDGKTVKVKWYLTADWKFLATLLGLNQASSKSFCLWCHCKKKEICDFDKPSWNILRQRGDHNRFLGQREHKGHVLPSLVDFNFDEIVPDVLHMVVVWAINQRRTQELAAAMKDTGVPFRLMEGTGDDGKGSIKTWTQLNAKQLERVFEKLDLKAVLTDRWSPAGLTETWPGNSRKKGCLGEKRLAEFLHSDQHVPYFLKKYNYINDLSCESVEQKNYTQNRRFHHGSQRSGRGSKRIVQVMEYENRDLFAVLNNVDRLKAIMGPNSAQRRTNLQGDQQTEDEEQIEEEIRVDMEDGYEDEETFEEDDDEDA